jgi:hypothetical protein
MHVTVTGLLPKGNIPMLNAQLQVEWFYMTLHKSDCMEYVQSGHKLSNKTLQTIAEYFQSIHKTRENYGSLMRHQIKKIQAKVKRKLCRKLEELYARKLPSIGAIGLTIETTAANIVVSMAAASSPSSPMMAVAATTNATTGRVPPSAKTRTSSPVASTVSMPRTRMKSAVPIRATKHIRNCAQTTTSAGMKVTTMIIATQVVAMSCAGTRILPCPALVKQARATRAKPRRIFT